MARSLHRMFFASLPNVYRGRGTYLCTGCHHPVAAPYGGQCQVKDVTLCASAGGVKRGPCPCRVEHALFVPRSA